MEPGSTGLERVILVDERDRELGSEEKLEVHRSGELHRAFSIFVFDDADRLLLQRRALAKYHSGGLWSNTCCGHPRPQEPVVAAARRRLHEEMGFDCPLQPAFTFIYRARLTNDLTEHELDHVLVGRFSGRPSPDPAEIAEWRAAPVAEVVSDTMANPEAYSVWFPTALEGLVSRGYPTPPG